MSQSSLVSLERIALIVCTRDRTGSLIDLLRSIVACGAIPKVVTVVDSNPSSATAQAVAQTFGTGQLSIKYIRSSAGLPYQRNLGITSILESEDLQCCDVIAFLDDDVEVPTHYFSTLLSLFDKVPSAIGFGGSDVNTSPIANRSILLRAALVTKSKPGAILSSGFTTTPDASDILVKTEWFPGFAMAFRRTVFESHRFDSRMAFYGEDLEFQIRARACGDLMVSSRLKVHHKAHAASRDSIRDKWSYSDGFRWALSRRANNCVSSTAVLYSTLCLLALESARYLLTGAYEYRLALMGHMDFLSRVIRGRQVQKLRIE